MKQVAIMRVLSCMKYHCKSNVEEVHHSSRAESYLVTGKGYSDSRKATYYYTNTSINNARKED
jgi:hypothetical protein